MFAHFEALRLGWQLRSHQNWLTRGVRQGKYDANSQNEKMLPTRETDGAGAGLAVKSLPQKMDALTLGEHFNASVREGTQGRMLRLPRELRDRIFEFAMVARQGFIEIWLENKPRMIGLYAPNKITKALRKDGEDCIRTYAALSRTCRQARDEARTCFLGMNTFCAEVYSLRKGVSNSATFGRLSDMLPHMKRVVLCQNLVIYHPWRTHSEDESKQDITCIVELKIVKAELQIEVAASPSGLFRFIPTRYGGVGQLRLLADEHQQLVIDVMQYAIENIREGVQECGCFNQRLIDVLAEDMREAAC
ncbi:hypothetical protein LTR10_006288 [Elasticomyces elasticus]|nr:hypothetical protein LTR10_006288 [Elasticomyces elasticus]KAK4966662.1 hypothetical protein LTR42_010973 [Elasticomyces elasticus]